ncbi:MAG TPA: alpha/beta fold hydrolase, partial [Caulobacteraceae bacterium]|nr:alpha/beta fold hydrolase [Caulobacteraceae bacterium]
MVPSSKTRLSLLAILASLPMMALALHLAPARAAEIQAAAPASARFTVTVRGQGPDVILIPGLASSARVWDVVAARLQAHYRLHIVQVSGFAGAAAGPNASGPVLQPLVDGIANYIQTQHLNQPVVIGHSLGGLAGLLLVIQHPSQVGRLMIVDSLPWYGAAVAGPAATPATLQPQAAALRDAVVAESQEAYAASEPAAMARLVKSDGPEAHAALAAAVASDHRVVGQATYDDLMTDLRDRLS